MCKPASNESGQSYVKTTSVFKDRYNTSAPNLLWTGLRLKEFRVAAFIVQDGDRINLRMESLGTTEVPETLLEARCTKVFLRLRGVLKMEIVILLKSLWIWTIADGSLLSKVR